MGKTEYTGTENPIDVSAPTITYDADNVKSISVMYLGTGNAFGNFSNVTTNKNWFVMPSTSGLYSVTVTLNDDTEKHYALNYTAPTEWTWPIHEHHWYDNSTIVETITNISEKDHCRDAYEGCSVEGCSYNKKKGTLYEHSFHVNGVVKQCINCSYYEIITS